MALGDNESVAASVSGKILTLQIDRDAGTAHAEKVVEAIKCYSNSQIQCDHATQATQKGNVKCRWLVLGHRGTHPEAISISELLIHTWRRHRLHTNERQTVLSVEDQLIVVQLCLASMNKEKFGEFDVETSHVVDLHQRLLEDRLKYVDEKGSHSDLTIPEDNAELKQVYGEFLKGCNMVDLIDVLCMVKDELAKNEDLRRNLLEANYILVNCPQSKIEVEMLHLLATAGLSVYVVRVGEPLGSEGSLLVETETSTLDTAVAVCDGITATPASVTENYIEGVLVSYLQLLVNSRSELSVARALNVPERELDHKAFTTLKKEAKTKGLSMLQTASSYVMKLRLGGRGYAPPADHALGPYVKGLGEFVDLLSKLQTIIEEVTDCSKAVKRIINIIKNTIVKHRDNVLRRESVEQVAERLQHQAALVMEVHGSTNPYSPERAANVGGSVIGRDTVRVLRHLVDSHAGSAMITRSVDVLSDGLSSQRTPIRLPCLFSKFRSPVELTPEDKLNMTLAERLLQKMTPQQKVLAVPRYQSCYDWAQPLHDTGLGNKASPSISKDINDCIPSKTLVQPGPHKVAPPRRLLESLHDQENVPVPSGAASAAKEKRHDQSEPAVCSTNAGSKRPLAAVEGSEGRPEKRRKAMAARANTKIKKRGPGLQKGQKQLTAFFRI